MRVESYLEALAREKAESAHSVADYFNRIGIPATVNNLGEAVHDIHPSTAIASSNSSLSSCHTDRAITPEIATKAGASDETLRKLHQNYQSRFGHRLIYQEVRRENDRAQATYKNEWQRERKHRLQEVAAPLAMEAMEKTGVNTLLHKNQMSNTVVEKIIALEGNLNQEKGKLKHQPVHLDHIDTYNFGRATRRMEAAKRKAGILETKPRPERQRQPLSTPQLKLKLF